MKKLLFIVAFLLLASSAIAQTFNYQAIARDNSGELITNQNLGVEISILQSGPSGTVIYTENHTPTTNSYGAFDIAIGAGTTPTSDFSLIDWSTNNYWLQVAIDQSGGTTYNIVGSSQLKAVPFAMYAASGNTGPEGPQGDQGPQGFQGEQGIAGIQGPEGPAGADGAVGPEGPQGPKGDQGPQGFQGEQGIAGVQGPEGPAGADGAVGPEGPQGDQGPQGFQGEQGIAGVQGPEGPAGADGAVGPEGPQGPKGDQGPQGFQGEQGIAGVQGPEGPAGPDGAVGPEGPQGPKGDQGPQGFQGEQGIAGVQGPEGPAGANGKGIASTVDNNDGTFTITYTDATTFTSSDLTGPVGATGADGPQGPQGIQGVGISNSSDNGDGTLTFNFTDGTNFTTPNLVGPEGPQGDPATNIITNLFQNTVSGVITYVNEETGSQTANVVSNDSNNRITVGSDGGAYLGFRYFDAYDATGFAPITTTFSTIAFNTTRINLNGFTMTNGVITIPQKGLYEITYTVSFDHTANINSRANIETVLDLNGSTVPGTSSYTYHRRNFGQGSTTKTVILDLSVNQTISVKSRITNNNNNVTIETIAEGSSITIKRLQ